MKRPIALACIVALATCLAATAAAESFRIMPDGSGDFSDIQTALTACDSGDTILVTPGIFYERIVWPETDGLILLGETTPEECILDGENSYRLISIITSVSETTVIKGLTIQNGSASGGGAIWCTAGASPTIEGNILQNNRTETGGGISCTGGASPLIVGNLITNNDAYLYGGGGGGIAVLGSSNPTIIDNQIVNNTGVNGGGIALIDGSAPTITDNLIAENTVTQYGGGVLIYGASDPCSGLIARNTIRNNFAGLVGGGGLCQ